MFLLLWIFWDWKTDIWQCDQKEAVLVTILNSYAPYDDAISCMLCLLHWCVPNLTSVKFLSSKLDFLEMSCDFSIFQPFKLVLLHEMSEISVPNVAKQLQTSYFARKCVFDYKNVCKKPKIEIDFFSRFSSWKSKFGLIYCKKAQ